VFEPQTGPRITGLKLWEEAYCRIRDSILRGDIPLGSPISRRQLAAQYRMSLLPVSEALRRLELDGLVETERRAGTRVRIPTVEEVEERITVREALESQSARLFSEKAIGEEREDLLKRAERLDCLRDSQEMGKDKGLFFAIHRLHCEFHLRIAEAAKCAALRDLIEQNQVLIMNWLYDVASGNQGDPRQFHIGLARVLVGDDPDASERAMRQHVRTGLGIVIQWIQVRLRPDEWRLKSGNEGSTERARGGQIS